jgi:hypothetical protein
VDADGRGQTTLLHHVRVIAGLRNHKVHFPEETASLKTPPVWGLGRALTSQENLLISFSCPYLCARQSHRCMNEPDYITSTIELRCYDSIEATSAKEGLS